MSSTYYASKISENIARTSENFLVCTDCIIARTGFQRYSVRDLPQERAAQLGIDVSNPFAEIDLYRPASEVFAPATIASFEGKVVTADHPIEFVNSENFRQYVCGHVQNVRKGKSALDSGDWPLIADLILIDADLISMVENGLRELSCGYEFSLNKDTNDRVLQTDLRGNHVAVVRKGRAGAEARINDGAPETEYIAEAVIAPVVAESSVKVEPAEGQFQKKEKHKMKKSWKQHLIGLGLRALASDAETTPEDLAEAAKDAAEQQHIPMPDDATGAKDAEEEKKKEEAKDRAARDAEEKEKKDKEAVDAKRMKDAAEEEEKKKEAEAKDKAARDAAEKSHHQPCGVKDCNDRDCRMHGALDSVLEKYPKKEGEDADMDELRELMGQFAAGGGAAPEHDSAESSVIEPIPMPEEGTDGEKEMEMEAAKDRAAAADAAREQVESINKLKAAVARTGDKAAIQAFNQMYATRSSRASAGSYAGVAGAARVLDTKNRNAMPGVAEHAGKTQEGYDDLQAYYDKVRGKNPQEVK